MSIRVIGFAGVLMMNALPAFAAGCHVDPFTNVLGAETTVQMTAKSSASCSIRFGQLTINSTPTAGDRTMAISAQAQHGTATVDGANHVSYVSAKGYVGPDQFVIERSGVSFTNRTGRSRSGTALYDVTVNVTP